MSFVENLIKFRAGQISCDPRRHPTWAVTHAVTPLLVPDLTDSLDKRKAKSERLKKKFTASGEVHKISFTWREEIGSPIEKITQVIHETHPTVLVLGSNNKNFLERAFLGSVSRHFSNQAECPVLIVPHSHNK